MRKLVFSPVTTLDSWVYLPSQAQEASTTLNTMLHMVISVSVFLDSSSLWCYVVATESGLQSQFVKLLVNSSSVFARSCSYQSFSLPSWSECGAAVCYVWFTCYHPHTSMLLIRLTSSPQFKTTANPVSFDFTTSYSALFGPVLWSKLSVFLLLLQLAVCGTTTMEPIVNSTHQSLEVSRWLSVIILVVSPSDPSFLLLFSSYKWWSKSSRNKQNKLVLIKTNASNMSSTVYDVVWLVSNVLCNSSTKQLTFK